MKVGDYVLMIELPNFNPSRIDYADFFKVNRIYRVVSLGLGGETVYIKMLDSTYVDYGVKPERLVNLSLLMTEEEILRFVKINNVETVPI